MDLQQFLYLAGTVVFAFACRTCQNRYLFKLGSLALLAATYLAGYFLTGSHAAGGCGIALWFVLPWVEIVARVRHMRFPLKSEVKSSFPPSRDTFPDLDTISREVENEGFVRVDDAGWKWHEADHFMRLFYHEGKRAQASVALAQQEGMAFSYVSVTTRIPSGVIYTTTNYPFPPTMQYSPTQRINRHFHAESMADLLATHEDFLQSQAIDLEDRLPLDTEQLPAYIERDMSTQIDHNLNAGLIEVIGEGEFRYSWRGCFYLWFEIVKDMVRV